MEAKRAARVRIVIVELNLADSVPIDKNRRTRVLTARKRPSVCLYQREAFDRNRGIPAFIGPAEAIDAMSFHCNSG